MSVLDSNTMGEITVVPAAEGIIITTGQREGIIGE